MVSGDPTLMREVAGMAVPVAGRWRVNPQHTYVGFTVHHLLTVVRGRFRTFGGTIVIADGVVAAATVQLYDGAGNTAARAVGTTADALGRVTSTVTTGGGVPLTVGAEYAKASRPEGGPGTSNCQISPLS